MEKLYAFYLKYVKETKYVPLSYDQFGDMLTKLNYIVDKDEHEIHGLLIYGEDTFVDINLVIGQVESFKPMIEKLIANTTKDIRIHYNKPCHLPWYAHHQMIHPNEQGVVYDSPLHKIYLELGFRDTSIQDTYYLDLKTFKIERTIKERLETLNYQGYDVTLYNPSKHTQMQAFLNNLAGNSFRMAIEKNIKKQHPDPLLIVTKDNQVMGFAGPLLISDDFRGVFSGIELLNNVRGLGLGKILFNNLCYTLAQMGAHYMTLFTGRENAAKFIYLNAGFKVAESFALMIYKRN